MTTTRVFQMPNGKWYWSDEYGHKSSNYGTWKHSAGKASKMEAIDDLASHINFRHIKEFKFEKERKAGNTTDINNVVEEYLQSHNAIKHALLTRLER